MREIKFRVWDKELKYMHTCGENSHDSCFYGLNNEFHYYNLQNGDGSGENGGYILMQYVGLKDKNGKEIYEGDIVKVVFQGEVEKYYVLYDESNTCFRMFSTLNFPKDSFCDFTENETDLYEVIGNIYKNPELLEDK